MSINLDFMQGFNAFFKGYSNLDNKSDAYILGYGKAQVLYALKRK